MCFFITVPPRKKRRLDGLDGLGSVTVSEESALDNLALEREQRRDATARLRMGKAKTSSEELTVPHELSKLTAFFKEILDGEVRKLESEAMDEDESEEVKVDLEGMLSFHAQENGGTLNKRDMALGFMQTLILKNENIISVEQNEWNGEIALGKGPSFYTQIPQ